MSEGPADMRQTGTVVTVGDDLYGFSLDELRDRISILQTEIARTEAELVKKQAERSAADQLFASKS